MQPPIISDLSFVVQGWLQEKSIIARTNNRIFILKFQVGKGVYVWNGCKIAAMGTMDSTQIIGLFAGALTATSLLPQVIKTVKEKKAEDVSLIMLLVLQAGIILWIIYGIKRDDAPIIWTNSFSLLVNITMVILRIRYRPEKERWTATS